MFINSRVVATRSPSHSGSVGVSRNPKLQSWAVRGFASILSLGFVATFMLAAPAVSSTASATSDPLNPFDAFGRVGIEEVQSITVAEGFDNEVVREGFTITEPVVVEPVVVAASSAPAAGSPNPGSAQAIALSMLNERGLGAGEYNCLVSLWQRESSWNVYAYNASSGAYGIPQSLPGNKMASAGADWATNPATQISWGLGYISGRYGSPCGAWAFSESNGWY